MLAKITKLAPLIAITLIPVLLVWFPFFLRLASFWGIPLPQNGMATIVANYDGPLYLVTAKSFYNPEIIKSFEFSLPVQYYAAHFPLFPLLIKLFAAPFGFPYAMLGITIASSFLVVYFFYKFIKEYVNDKNAIWLTLVFSVLPARFLIVRSVGSPEPLFVAAIIASLYYFRREKFLWAGIWGAIAQLTKSPGILLFIAYCGVILSPKIGKIATESFAKWFKELELKKYLPLLLIPAAALLIFILYGIQLKDFFAYFHSGDNIHLFFPPFSVFNYSSPWVGTFWLEEVIFVYLFGILTIVRLFNFRERVLGWFVGIFFASLIFVSHRDLIRYALPITPFVMLAFSETLIKKEFKIAMAVLAIPIYLFSLAYISQNVMPISDWAPFL
ncbi:MAG TPA: hypothetical protein VJ481_00575 [Patescibacteria group bacterium]|uniref:Uncharacterized protein n=1 Tax=Candidatus Woesebacteria bacterium RBG_13_46_13 TaxID=1802479 RepID=A0A1F7X5N0_9BACT|nr:MAG: hypothetical protein A2Y68_02970 [Candidatus Woesebacteria bacterium RBG_13_46_13]HJX59038.1 hypothetical protein [Patescibacteria group bacterium]